jgi:hypothetical protein
MTGKRIPLILIPRYTSYVGVGDFYTAAMDVSAFESSVVHVWRGELIGDSPTISLAIEESHDQDTWAACSGGSAFDPGEKTEVTKEVTLTKRFLRIAVTLGGSNTGATCLAYGYLNARQH